ncbi:MAG: AmmeMemoRadiSam system protein B [Ignavibacteriae bacterium]|nr:AmmeMemoRadiSam system protein B [Ignavibacteriota bacterium]MCB9215385.1 AmmeMemoRadiSam system protein B [Ignavibacteria bacterium]
MFSETTPLPPLRHDLDAVEIMPGIIRLYDDLGYTDSTVQLPIEIIDYLLYMDGKRTVLELAGHAAQAGFPFDSMKFLEIVEILEEEGFLETETFQRQREELHHDYNSLTLRPAFHAGYAYPDDPDELRAMLDQYLSPTPEQLSSPTTTPVGFFIPHVDPRLGGQVYGAAYNAMRENDADTFIILGVPHRMSYDRFMFSTMDFDTPLGAVETDREFIAKFRENLSFHLTEDQIAHRIEHSIEFQALFLRHLFPDRPIRIVPILANSLYDYVETGRGGAEEDEKLTELYTTLSRTAAELKRKVCWIASVDFCHVGRKFGDSFDARTILDKVRRHDEKLIEAAAECNAGEFLQRLVDVRNEYKVCGVSPMYAMLRAANLKRGELLAYDQWDEEETDSAVSFASMAFYR